MPPAAAPPIAPSTSRCPISSRARACCSPRFRTATIPTISSAPAAPGRFAPDRRGSRPGRGERREGGNWRPPSGRFAPGGFAPGGFASGALGPASARLQASSIVRGSRTALPPREALILIAACNHPWLIESHAEELADLEFLNADADLLRRSMLEAAA